ncbi:MAG: tetratricopeptide repeat protein [Candidatus Lokiarchaeota archaeon]|nr:tetratricopeptide repeat protein [Candidatus Lokiarchaeota archaeon]
MSINPFSSNEIKNLREVIEKNGWKINGSIENYFRYSVKKEKILIFTIKFPITLPIRINIPFEVINFRVSIAFQLWNLNQSTYTTTLYIMKALRKLAISLTLEHNFPIKGKEPELIDLLNLVMPELIRDENENTWINRIRISLMNKREQLEDLSDDQHRSLVGMLIKLGLEPSFNLPWELYNGVPKLRTSETLFFSNKKDFDEFFILEKGFFTYLKDLEYKKFYIRSSFDSYSPHILIDLFNKYPEFKLELLVENWIKFTRMILNAIIEVIENGKIKQNELLNFRPSKELIYRGKNFILDQNNFPFSPLCYESSIAKELFPFHNDLFNTPPTNFEVIESINHYTNAEELIKNYRFEEATKLLNDSLKIFNKNQQKKVVVSILLKLRKIATLLGNDDLALNYLQSALSIAKSGEVPIDYIIRIHQKLGISYFKNKNYEKALDHFDIIRNFLEKENISLTKKSYVGMAYLYTGLIYLEQNKIVDSKKCFKKVLEIGVNSIKIRLKYFLTRAVHFKNQGNLSQAQRFLKAGLNVNEISFNNNNHQNVLIDFILELSEFYIHHRKDSRKALYYLNSLENHLSAKEVNNIKRAIRWNSLMSDYYNSLEKNHQKSQFYVKQSQILKNQLHTIGVNK